ncbi:tyrosine-type recombinase/integrase [Paraburkholderia phymatum]|uniref:tyrosine-type recombinase/integrase n=1 Tax=Paraburkholderia phymatum TaxID=148447 RepID=UPI00317023C8
MTWTRCAYKRELERLMLWCVAERGVAPSSMTVEDAGPDPSGAEFESTRRQALHVRPLDDTDPLCAAGGAAHAAGAREVRHRERGRRARRDARLFGARGARLDALGNRSAARGTARAAGSGAPQADAHVTARVRHTVATQMLASGTALEVVQQTLGHASLGTTSIYISREATRLRREAAKYHARLMQFER